MSFSEIENLLKDVMGLTSASVGSSTIARAIKRRMQNLAIQSEEEYFSLVVTNKNELKNLIETVVIPETWFFRDYNPFIALQNHIRKNWKYDKNRRMLRILSIPCSTGEEPYSIAMAMFDEGLTDDDFQIDAIDISQENIRRALSGDYGAHSFRGDVLDYRDRYFTLKDDRYFIDDRIKNRVNFSCSNLLDPDFKPPCYEYDVIFCRNLLIYFDRKTQQQAVKIFHGLLNKDGLLFIGHAESGAVPPGLYDSLQYSKAFAYQKSKPESEKSRTTTTNRKNGQHSLKRKPIQATRVITTRAKLNTQTRPVNVRKKTITETPSDTTVKEESEFNPLTEIESLANQGHLTEAAQLCDRLISQEPYNAQAFYLLGVIRDAAGNKDLAEEGFKKAIYLNPDHAEAMFHLAVILDHRGETQSAAKYRDRAERVRTRQTAGA